MKATVMNDEMPDKMYCGHTVGSKTGQWDQYTAHSNKSTVFKDVEYIRADLANPEKVEHNIDVLKAECHAAASDKCSHAQHPHKWIDAAIEYLYERGLLYGVAQENKS